MVSLLASAQLRSVTISVPVLRRLDPGYRLKAALIVLSNLPSQVARVRLELRVNTTFDGKQPDILALFLALDWRALETALSRCDALETVEIVLGLCPGMARIALAHNAGWEAAARREVQRQFSERIRERVDVQVVMLKARLTT